jgi:hypothetical protein
MMPLGFNQIVRIFEKSIQKQSFEDENKIVFYNNNDS